MNAIASPGDWPFWRRWAGQTFVVMASGPSMSEGQARYVWMLRQRLPLRVITVNTTYQLAPWADVHYSSDRGWWDLHLPNMNATECRGEFWTGDADYRADGVQCCPFSKRGRGLSRAPGLINWGGNSGYCALGLAYQFGAKKIILLGYDQQDKTGRGHWHGLHPESIRKGFNWPMWRRRFSEIARDFKREKIDVVNCSRETALRCFRRGKLEVELC